MAASLTVRWAGWLGTMLVILSCSAARAQDSLRGLEQPLVIGLYGQGSFIIPHSVSSRHLAVSHPTGFELNLQRQTTGQAPWHAWYRYPKVGVALVYYNYHNPVLGYSYAASAYINKNFWRTARQEINVRVGTGLGYFPVRFKADEPGRNHKNTMISSRLNATMQARVEYDLALSSHLGLLVGIGLNHYSNGSTSKPNQGINIPTLLVGLNYHQQRAFRPITAVVTEPFDAGRYFLNVSTAYGFKQRNESDRATYSVYSLTVAGGRRLNRKSNLLLGIDGFHDRSLVAELRDTARAGGSQPDTKKVGVYLGHELLFGRLAVVSQLGIYVYNPYKSNDFYYERLGLKYHFTNRWFGEVDLKVHRAAADVVEWRVGVKL